MCVLCPVNHGNTATVSTTARRPAPHQTWRRRSLVARAAGEGRSRSQPSPAVRVMPGLGRVVARHDPGQEGDHTSLLRWHGNLVGAVLAQEFRLRAHRDAHHPTPVPDAGHRDLDSGARRFGRCPTCQKSCKKGGRTEGPLHGVFTRAAPCGPARRHARPSGGPTPPRHGGPPAPGSASRWRRAPPAPGARGRGCRGQRRRR